MDEVLPRENIEYKSRARDLERAKRLALDAGGAVVGVLWQTDTYFHLPSGRLKLREIAGTGAELIWYDRADHAGTRASRCRICPVPNPADLLPLLSAAMGVRAVVRKRRTLLMLDNIRIHLDEVDRLGAFVEFEAVLDATQDPQSNAERVRSLVAALELLPDDAITTSYGDLIEALDR